MVNKINGAPCNNKSKIGCWLVSQYGYSRNPEWPSKNEMNTRTAEARLKTLEESYRLTRRTYRRMQSTLAEALSLLDGAMPVIETWDADGSQVEWKREWVEGVRKILGK